MNFLTNSAGQKKIKYRNKNVPISHNKVAVQKTLCVKTCQFHNASTIKPAPNLFMKKSHGSVCKTIALVLLFQMQQTTILEVKQVKHLQLSEASWK